MKDFTSCVQVEPKELNVPEEMKGMLRQLLQDLNITPVQPVRNYM